MNIKLLLKSNKFAQILGVVMLMVLISYGVVAKVKPNVSPNINNTCVNCQPNWVTSSLVKAKASLSQTKVLQGSDGEIYVQIDMEALDDGKTLAKKRMPTNFVVVLDRSGSMGSRGKMDYARDAVKSLIKQLKEGDQFSLVTFDSIIETPIELTKVNSDNMNNLLKVVSSITPRGSTDLGGGLKQGMAVLNHMKRAKDTSARIILISDGLTNVGITDPNKLNQMAANAVKGEFVVSTIGVGLDFNETLLASLADFGTGSYYFLEKPNKMDEVLAKEFFSAGDMLAKNLKIKFDFSNNMKVIDASGYPISSEGPFQIVQPGHLYRDQKKTLYVTLKVPTDSLYAKNLGKMELTYTIGETDHKIILIDNNVSIACLPAAKKQEVVASIDKDTYSNAWAQNNAGRVYKEGADRIRKGDYSSAQSVIKKYKAKLTKAYDMAPTPKMAQQLKELETMEQDVDDAVASGNVSAEEQKSMSKDMHFRGNEKQRK